MFAAQQSVTVPVSYHRETSWRACGRSSVVAPRGRCGLSPAALHGTSCPKPPQRRGQAHQTHLPLDEMVVRALKRCTGEPRVSCRSAISRAQACETLPGRLVHPSIHPSPPLATSMIPVGTISLLCAAACTFGASAARQAAAQSARAAAILGRARLIATARRRIRVERIRRGLIHGKCLSAKEELVRVARSLSCAEGCRTFRQRARPAAPPRRPRRVKWAAKPTEACLFGCCPLGYHSL